VVGILKTEVVGIHHKTDSKEQKNFLQKKVLYSKEQKKVLQKSFMKEVLQGNRYVIY